MTTEDKVNSDTNAVEEESELRYPTMVWSFYKQTTQADSLCEGTVSIVPTLVPKENICLPTNEMPDNTFGVWRRANNPTHDWLGCAVMLPAHVSVCQSTC